MVCRRTCLFPASANHRFTRRRLLLGGLVLAGLLGAACGSTSDPSRQCQRAEVGWKPAPPPTLAELVRRYDLIVLGQAVGAGAAHALADNSSQTFFLLGQVFSIRVDRYLKGAGDGTLDFFLSVGYVSCHPPLVGELPSTLMADMLESVRSESSSMYTRSLFFLHRFERDGLAFTGGTYFTVPEDGSAEPPGGRTRAHWATQIPSKSSAEFIADVERIIMAGTVTPSPVGTPQPMRTVAPALIQTPMP